ncbi:hypothetical protein I3F58_00610 [Streptomyces sp. MUM 203J]|uniref:DUF6114 domain-containing protein n=1 Tax=Streptomyces sp. MUM 203J TaxID=2791990 RepID=UPI001F04E1CC|nr:DUF6114 domain-containing protein [Streptomyces sp. MUM 203J]MCH0538085.1 hypothetical protein [Streptomyces sp. MUM 203J]
MSAESAAPAPTTAEQNEHYLRVLKRRFRAWRGNRPFWAGLLTLLGGIPIAYFPYASLHLGQMTVTMQTPGGSGSLIIGVLLVTLGLTMWFQPLVRIFAGVAAIMLALVSIPVSNFGGFVMGYLGALLGGALSIAWAPGTPAAEAGPEAAPEAERQATPVQPEAPAQTLNLAKEAPAPAPEPRPDATAPHDSTPTDISTETIPDPNGGRNSAG